jgi:hypothetical protein
MKGNEYVIGLERFNVFTFQPSVEEWLTWAYDNDIHPAVLYTLEQYPELFRDDSKELCPRKWAALGTYINRFGGNKIFEDCPVIKELFSEDVIKIIRECYQKGR